MADRIKNIRKQTRLLGRRWVVETRNAASGRVLNVRSGRLLESIRDKDGSRSKSPYYEVSADASDPMTDFPYALYHERYSGHEYIRPSLLIAFFGMREDFVRAASADGAEMLFRGMVEHGWQYGRKPNEVVKTFTIHLGRS